MVSIGLHLSIEAGTTQLEGPNKAYRILEGKTTGIAATRCGRVRSRFNFWDGEFRKYNSLDLSTREVYNRVGDGITGLLCWLAVMMSCKKIARVIGGCGERMEFVLVDEVH